MNDARSSLIAYCIWGSYFWFACENTEKSNWFAYLVSSSPSSSNLYKFGRDFGKSAFGLLFLTLKEELPRFSAVIYVKELARLSLLELKAVSLPWRDLNPGFWRETVWFIRNYIWLLPRCIFLVDEALYCFFCLEIAVGFMSLPYF